MYETQLLRIRIRPGKTGQVIEFIKSLRDRKSAALAAMRREGIIVETLFLERREDADYLYYYAKSRDLAAAHQVNMQATDPLTQEIRMFVAETWGEISSPEPILDLDLIKDEAAPQSSVKSKLQVHAASSDGEAAKPRPRRKAKPAAAPAPTQARPAPHALAGG